MVRTIHTTNRFEKDVNHMTRRGKEANKLRAAIELLVRSEPLPAALRDHVLTGDWRGYRDLHIEPDWLLIYRADANNLWLVRTGTHADLFRR